MGGIPYPGIHPRQVLPRLMEGHRMECPGGCPENMCVLCWSQQHAAGGNLSFSKGEMRSVLSPLCTWFLTQCVIDLVNPLHMYCRNCEEKRCSLQTWVLSLSLSLYVHVLLADTLS